MQGLTPILGRQSHLAVLRVIHHADTPLSGREVQRASGLSNRAAMQALGNLTAEGVLLKTVQGNAHFFSGNPRHYLWTKAVRPALDAEVGFWDDLRKTVRRHMHPKPEAAIVTGPLARSPEPGVRPPNQKDILEIHLLFATGRLRLQAYRSLDRLRENLRARYALDSRVTFMDIRTMDDPEFSPLWTRIAREGILVFGKLP
ncbi:MAG: hypothetical protein JJU05_14530 [Verrucomicrobia bacterium]|nr:hypothetical protein [Verrucomicrobiota bacterium]MCH8528304.1 hypothetical protein [Kiritimatiellia bacterium]